jgi:agmatine deiminase
MPAEWEPHAKTWMGWPRRPDNWRDGAKHARKAFAAVATAISEFEPVVVAVNHGDEHTARDILPDSVDVVCISHDDAWFRDTGPTFVVDGGDKQIGIDWEFNAWGGLYDSWDRDQAVAKTILNIEGVEREPCDLVLEGGSIHVDGEGTLLTTEECLLNPNRNPHMTKDQIETRLKSALGVQKIIWLPHGLYGDDDTNGHIDNIACFAEPGVVLLAWTDDVNDPQWDISTRAYDILVNSTDAKGRRLEVVKVPLPPPQYISKEEARGVKPVDGTKPRQAGERMAASYINFYIVNDGVVVPAFGGDAVETDEQARAILQNVFPTKTVVSVSTREILLGGGNIHCITSQQPKFL